MNSGIQDVFNLGWKLALVIKGLANPELLSSYNSERLPVIATMLNVTTSLLKLTFAARKSDSDVDAFRRGHLFKQYGVTYRGSPIVIDDIHTVADGQNKVIDPYSGGLDGRLCGGDRAPDAPGLIPLHGESESAIRTLFDLFGATYHTILIFSSDVPLITAVLEVVNRYPKGCITSAAIIPTSDKLKLEGTPDHIFHDNAGYAYKHYHASPQGSKIVVVRPDGALGCVTESVQSVAQYFRGIFREEK
jgi:hypothetical protein